MVLQNFQMIAPDVKYRAACLLELLTGQRPTLAQIDVRSEFCLSEDAIEANEKTVRSMVHTAKKKNLTPEELRMLADTKGTKLWCTLGHASSLRFLEKLAEFYLPESSSAEIGERQDPHSNAQPRDQLIAYFKAKVGTRPDRRAALQDSEKEAANPSVAYSAYSIKSSELFRFPDIELFYSELGPIFSPSSTPEADATATCLQLYLRPEIEVKEAFLRDFPDHFQRLGAVNRLQVMNYFLSIHFNPNMQRSYR